MGQVVTIVLDLAKSVFQVHGVDAAAEVVLRRQIRRSLLLQFFAKQPACLTGMEACASSHFWAREAGALGHEVKLMPAQYVKPYVKRGKNDAADAEAICEAVSHAVRPMLQARQALFDTFLELDRRVPRAAHEDTVCRRFMGIPGVGEITALSFKAAADDPARFQKLASGGRPLRPDAQTLPIWRE